MAASFDGAGEALAGASSLQIEPLRVIDVLGHQHVLTDGADEETGRVQDPGLTQTGAGLAQECPLLVAGDHPTATLRQCQRRRLASTHDPSERGEALELLDGAQRLEPELAEPDGRLDQRPLPGARDLAANLLDESELEVVQGRA
jgi:hypothetical protein